MTVNEQFIVGSPTDCSLCGCELKYWEENVCSECLQQIINNERFYDS